MLLASCYLRTNQWTCPNRYVYYDITYQDILEQTNDLINKGNKEILLVLTRELEANSDKITAEALAKFEPSITENEVYYLYLATKK